MRSQEELTAKRFAAPAAVAAETYPQRGTRKRARHINVYVQAAASAHVTTMVRGFEKQRGDGDEKKTVEDRTIFTADVVRSSKRDLFTGGSVREFPLCKRSFIGGTVREFPLSKR